MMDLKVDWTKFEHELNKIRTKIVRVHIKQNFGIKNELKCVRTKKEAFG